MLHLPKKLIERRAESGPARSTREPQLLFQVGSPVRAGSLRTRASMSVCLSSVVCIVCITRYVGIRCTRYYVPRMYMYVQAWSDVAPWYLYYARVCAACTCARACVCVRACARTLLQRVFFYYLQVRGTRYVCLLDSVPCWPACLHHECNEYCTCTRYLVRRIPYVHMYEVLCTSTYLYLCMYLYFYEVVLST